MNGLLDLSDRTTRLPDTIGMSCDPASWIRAIAERGDRAAFVSLFNHFAPRVKSFLMRAGLPAERAEELAQDTMVMVWRKAARFDPSAGSASAWIFTIARNLRIDAARRDRLAAAEADAIEDSPPPPPADTLFDAMERADRVRRAIALLPAEQAEVLRLSFFDDRPHSEIERALGIPLGTVKSRLRLAMARLRSLLDELR